MWTSGASWGKRLAMVDHENEKISNMILNVMFSTENWTELNNLKDNCKLHWKCFKGHVRKGCVMECRVNGEVVQKTEIAKMIWKVQFSQWFHSAIIVQNYWAHNKTCRSNYCPGRWDDCWTISPVQTPTRRYYHDWHSSRCFFTKVSLFIFAQRVFTYYEVILCTKE